MVRRKIIPLIAGSALVLPTLLLGAFRAAPAGSPVPGGSEVRAAAPRTDGTERVLVEWVIRSADLVACETVTPELRRKQHQYQGQVRFVAYAVGADPALVQSFLRRERLARVELHSITEREFQAGFARRFGAAANARTLLVVTEGAEAQVFDAAVRTASGRRGVADFAAYLDGIVTRGGLAGVHPVPSIRTR
jgi:hypothetical protein